MTKLTKAKPIIVQLTMVKLFMVKLAIIKPNSTKKWWNN
jgi:hypothetical protein